MVPSASTVILVILLLSTVGIAIAPLPSPSILILGKIWKLALLAAPDISGEAAPVNNSTPTRISALPVAML